MDKALERKLRKICEEHPEEVIRVLLEAAFWPKSLKTNTQYSRYDDDTYMGHISVVFSGDSDGWLDIMSEKDPEDMFSHRFRNFFGGGQSERVRNAILILAMAIKLDNEDRPQHRPPRNKDLVP